jgi:small GTP-binding protein
MSGFLKVVLLGDHGVGKTSLVSRWSKQNYRPDQPPTIGAAFSQQEVKVDGEIYKLQIWDTAGEERYQAMAPIYSQGACGAFLVFDVRARITLEHLTIWQKCLESCEPNVCVIVVGNKSDAEDRTIKFTEGEEFAAKFGYDYAETSALNGAGVDETFTSLTEKAVNARAAKQIIRGSDIMDPGKGRNRKDGQCC